MAEQIDSVEALQEKLGEMLVSGSLYRRFVYQGKDCHRAYAGGGTRYGTLPSSLDYSLILLAKEVRML